MGILKWVAVGVSLAAIGGAALHAQYRDTEEPSYEVVTSDKRFELREYAPMIVAEVTHEGDRRRASGASFRRLAAYIFAQDRPAGGEAIAMTSPVIQERVDQDERIEMTSPVLQEETGMGKWRTRFVMPARFTMETLPQPPADIALVEVPSRRVAAVRFSGVARSSDLAIMEERLSQWVDAQGLIPVGSFEYAFYDAPMVPGPMRRNEVLIEVAAER
ncbi:heme-binding protein [uncultured Erythrobacter sp.]|uniref:SOUL family heme-binding protein n=1 Tax=uncultured Erythrobacter sp. TaxID=263913 RepID=UPI00262F3966|nr:heme-binding protein [uncultured Erythrobacter sp.]